MKKFICEFGSKYFTCDCVTVIENASSKNVSSSGVPPSSCVPPPSSDPTEPSDPVPSHGVQSATLLEVDRFKSGLKRTSGVKDMMDLVKE